MCHPASHSPWKAHCESGVSLRWGVFRLLSKLWGMASGGTDSVLLQVSSEPFALGLGCGTGRLVPVVSLSVHCDAAVFRMRLGVYDLAQLDCNPSAVDSDCDLVSGRSTWSTHKNLKSHFNDLFSTRLVGTILSSGWAVGRCKQSEPGVRFTRVDTERDPETIL